jgi:nucleoid DNA-binding protein
MRKIPLNICQDCGGDWFREADYYEFLREESLSSWPTWPDLVGQINRGPMTLLVCLCGTPRAPSIGGVRGGRTPNVELAHLVDSLQNCQAWLKDHHDGDLVLAAAEAHLAKAESFQVLAGQMKDLEKLAGPRIAQQPPSRKSPRGRYWAPSKRKPVSGDVLTLDTLVIALQGIGFTARLAKKAVNAIFEAITEWLKDGGFAKTPLGVFKAVRRPPKRTLVRLGHLQNFNMQPQRIAFRISRELQEACNQSIQKEISVPIAHVNIKSNQQQCEKCGSTHFVEAQFRQYRPQYSAAVGGDISPITENPVRALVCLCGHPVLPGRLRKDAPGVDDPKSYQKSLEAARQYWERTRPETIVRKLAEIYANQQQHDELAERIAKMETILKEPLPLPPGLPSKP